MARLCSRAAIFGRLPQRQAFLPRTAADLAYHHQPAVDADAHRQVNALVLGQAGMQRTDGVEDAQTSAHGPLGIVFVGHRIAKVDE